MDLIKEIGVKKNILIAVGVVVFLLLAVRVGFSLKAVVAQKKDMKAKATVAQNAVNLYQQGMAAEANNEFLDAQAAYKKVVSDYPDFDKIEDAQKKLEAINMKIIFSTTETPSTTVYTVQHGDSLAKIAKQNNTTIELIKKSNNRTSDMIKVGQRLRLWKGTFSVYVDKSQNTLMLKSGNDIVKIYSVSTGKNNSTPVGTFTIVTKTVNPVWFKEGGKVIPPESPENILGTRWMGFNEPHASYGIHGTTEPEKIGKQVTAGCVRMRNEEVEELYSLLPEGTQVTIVD